MTLRVMKQIHFLKNTPMCCEVIAWHSLTSIIFQGGAILMLQGMETAEQSYIFIPSIKECQHMDSRT